MKALLLCLMLAGTAYSQQIPHFVKTVELSPDGTTVQRPQSIELAVAWLLKRAPDYWVKLEAFTCDADIESKDDPKEKLIQKAMVRGKKVKQELVSRTIEADKIEIVALGKAENPSRCTVRLVAGPEANMAKSGPDKKKK